jgi:hypothetical protein
LKINFLGIKDGGILKASLMDLKDVETIHRNGNIQHRLAIKRKM